jgi:hypothetical protein
LPKPKLFEIIINFRYDLNNKTPISPDTFSPVIPGEPAGRHRSGERLLLDHPAALQFGFQAHLGQVRRSASGLPLSCEVAAQRQCIFMSF